MRSGSHALGALAALLSVGCSVEPPGVDDGETDLEGSNPVEDADEGWAYQTWCWFGTENGCKFEDGTRVGDHRVNCVDVDDTYACVTDDLNELGADGWRIELVNDPFPNEAVIYLTYRAL